MRQAIQQRNEDALAQIGEDPAERTPTCPVPDTPQRLPYFRNWAGNQCSAVAAIEHPTSEAELVRIVKAAAAAGQRVKPVGAGHSFTEIALTDGRLLRLDGYTELLAADPERCTVTVQAGIRLWRLNRKLAACGLALPNLGDIAYQSIAGAIATATHGTGRALGNLATFVAALRLVLADGSVVECSAAREPELFRAARVGLGALGIISTVTLQCVPAFQLHAVEMPMRLDAVLETLDGHVDGNDHFEFFWFPEADWALTKRNNRTTRPAAPRGRLVELRDDILWANLALGALCCLSRLRPGWIPRLWRAVPEPRRVEYVDRSDRAFTSPRLVHFLEMEYAIPRAHAAEALRRVRSFIRTSGLHLNFPVEVRFVAADDIPLSPAYGRETCYIAVHVYRGDPYDTYFRGVEHIMDDYGGRPHWGKLHFQTAETLAMRYPEWRRFQALRARLDPTGRFTNPYLERVLGPVSAHCRSASLAAAA